MSASSFPLSASITGSLVPGITGIPADIIVFLASCLLPVFSMISESGPINVMLHFSHNDANLLFSERNPKPGCIASACVATVALNILSILR